MCEAQVQSLVGGGEKPKQNINLVYSGEQFRSPLPEGALLEDKPVCNCAGSWTSGCLDHLLQLATPEISRCSVQAAVGPQSQSGKLRACGQGPPASFCPTPCLGHPDPLWSPLHCVGPPGSTGRMQGKQGGREEGG